MDEVLSFVRAFEVWIYLILGLGGLFFLQRFYSAWQELRGAGFGLERNQAQSRVNQAASVLVLVLILAIGDFVLVSFVVPSVPGANPLPTATLDLLATPSASLPPGVTASAAPIQVLAGTQPPQAGTPRLTPGTSAPGTPGTPTVPGCVPGQIEISFPTPGADVKGVIEIKGSAATPNFGFYKIEMKRPDDAVWATLQAGNQVVRAGKLGDWDTRRLSPGEYLLGLVVVDNKAQAAPPCTVRLRVSRTVETTPNP
jgi:hypothetical protein